MSTLSTRPAAALSLATTDRSPLVIPRGRLIDAPKIVKRFFTDDEGNAVVNARWVRDNMPYKIPLSHSRVVWYDGDVERVIAEAARLGVPVKSVKLADIESAA